MSAPGAVPELAEGYERCDGCERRLAFAEAYVNEIGVPGGVPTDRRLCRGCANREWPDG